MSSPKVCFPDVPAELRGRKTRLTLSAFDATMIAEALKHLTDAWERAGFATGPLFALTGRFETAIERALH